MSNPTENHAELLLKIFYFLYYAAAASLLPFLVLFYEQLELSGRQIGVLTAILPLVTLFAATFWGGLADATQRHRRLLGLAICGAMVMALVLSLASTFPVLVILVTVFAFFVAPIIPLMDNSALTFLGEQKRRYGKLRLWGAVGWGVAAPVVGQLVAQLGQGWSFYSYGLFMLAGLIISVRLPISQVHIGQTFWQGMRLLLGSRQWRYFLIIIFIAGIGSSLIHNYLFLYMEQLGANETLMGLALSVATLSELVVFSSSGRLLDRWGIRNLLLLALTTLAVRLLAYALVTNAWLVLPIQLLHGLSFSALWTAGVAYADKLAPPGLGATAQGLFTGVFFGVAAATGAFLGGILYEKVGLAWMYGWAGLGILSGLLFIGRIPADYGRISRGG
jgi:MFS family permease